MELSMNTSVSYKEIYHINDIIAALERMEQTGFTEMVFYHDKENKSVEMSAIHLEKEEES